MRSGPERVQKLLAAEGVGSRRDVETLIRDGKIRVNGRVARLGDRASVADEIFVGERRIIVRGAFDPAVIAYHKPCGEVVSRNGQSRDTVFDRLPRREHGRWVAVGRLDLNTSGLLLFSTDGELAHRLMHPAYRIPRTYRVRVRGRITDRMLDRLRNGVMLRGRTAHFESVEPCGPKNDAAGANRWFEVVLREGRNREVRRLWESQGVEVSRLIRVRFADIALGDAPSGVWRELDRNAAAQLYRAVDLASPPHPR